MDLSRILLAVNKFQRQQLDKIFSPIMTRRRFEAAVLYKYVLGGTFEKPMHT